MGCLSQISTLRFATRVRCVQTNPVRNTLKDPQVCHLIFMVTKTGCNIVNDGLQGASEGI